MRYTTRIFPLFILLGLGPLHVLHAQDDTTFEVQLVLVADDLTAPIAMAIPPDDSGRRFIVDMGGQVWIMLADDTILPEPFLDVADRLPALLSFRNDPRGLLGFAFHPKYEENGRFFVFYTQDKGERADISHTNILAEFRVSADDPNLADVSSERLLLSIEQQTIEHAAGQLLFEPDTGYLLVALGDDFHPRETSQNLENLLGKVLRIDIDNFTDEQPYTIPPDNPFAAGGGMPEIFAYGLRHPMRISYDADYGVLVSDPAWSFRNQRVYLLQAGANYGWQEQAEANCFDPADLIHPLESCVTGENGARFTPPIVEYSSVMGQIIIGGYVYRGSAFPEWEGRYIFGDWGENLHRTAKLFIATPAETEGGLWPMEEMTTQPTFRELRQNIWAFGQDEAGELYVMTTDAATIRAGTGQIYRIVRG